jgi:hypothetical protein
VSSGRPRGRWDIKIDLRKRGRDEGRRTAPVRLSSRAAAVWWTFTFCHHLTSSQQIHSNVFIPCTSFLHLFVILSCPHVLS